MLKRFVLWEGALASNLGADPNNVFADLEIERCDASVKTYTGSCCICRTRAALFPLFLCVSEYTFTLWPGIDSPSDNDERRLICASKSWLRFQNEKERRGCLCQHRCAHQRGQKAVRLFLCWSSRLHLTWTELAALKPLPINQ
jgi:hypothetical protein